jgi:hypothetical protein
MCMNCGGAAGAHYLSCPKRPDLMLTVERDGPIIKSEWSTLPELLEAVAAAASVLVAEPDTTVEVRFASTTSATAAGASACAGLPSDLAGRCCARTASAARR